ncbi:MIP/aquaporin family protein [Streptomyces cynarae]|uniref:MIP/aquaporin family protein n=1 Tax=Streptomyces cynarae TaxID=2981134 RepID=UPI00406D11EA
MLTTALLYCVVTAARWLTSADSPVAVDNLRAATATVGVAVGIVLVLLITSPPGRRSGAHMNPAISVALWLMGAFPGRYLPAYATAQLAGSVAGTALARWCWGPIVARSSMRYAAVHPNPAWNTAALVCAEGGCLVLMVLMVGFFLAHPSVSRWLPYAVGVATALVITVLGGLSGGSANPARQLGPALLSGGTQLLWVYLVAPLIGASLGAAVHCLLQRRLGCRAPSTYRLCGNDDAVRDRVR